MPAVELFVIPFKRIVNELLIATPPPVGTLNDTVVAVFVMAPMATPLNVPPEIPARVNPAGKVITTALPSGIPASGLFSVFAIRVKFAEDPAHELLAETDAQVLTMSVAKVLIGKKPIKNIKPDIMKV